MESFFFNITQKRYKVTAVIPSLQRIDISNGVVFIEGKVKRKTPFLKLNNLDRMVMIVMVRQGELHLEDMPSGEIRKIKTGEIGMFTSSQQDMVLRAAASKQCDLFLLFVADFFLKRYLSGNREEPIDYLYEKMQHGGMLEEIGIFPIDAVALYLVDKLLHVSQKVQMKSLYAEHLVTEFMLQRFSLLNITETVDEDELTLAQHARTILLQDFVHPPTLQELAHRCATNSSKLKKVFKKVYKVTIHTYVEKLRLEEASLLLKEESVTIGEIANRVGYRHQGYFSKRFFETYGVYPKTLKQ